MTHQTRGSVVFKLIWQICLLAGLVLAAWVVAQILPIKASALNPENQVASKATVEVYPLPRLSENVASALDEIIKSVSGAKLQVLVVARRISSAGLLTAMSERKAAGVPVYTLLSPDTAKDFTRSSLAAWLKRNNLTDVYKDLLTSTSHIVIVDQKTVFISDLPFSEKSFESLKAEDNATVLGFAYKIEDSALAVELATALKQRIVRNNKLL